MCPGLIPGTLDVAITKVEVRFRMNNVVLVANSSEDQN
jgi:hypothetical protein